MESSSKRVASEKSVQKKETPNIQSAGEEGTPKKDGGGGTAGRRKQGSVVWEEPEEETVSGKRNHPTRRWDQGGELITWDGKRGVGQKTSGNVQLNEKVCE